jgi:hypothetical protein
VSRRVLRGQEEDGGLEPPCPQPASDLDAFDVREHPVEHDEIGLVASDRLERSAAGRRLVHLVALVAERRRDGIDDRRLVVDDEDALSGCGTG